MSVHPYEEPAFDLYPLQNDWSQAGSGIVGELDESSQDIDCRKHDGAACNDRPHAVERIGMLERTGEDGHFGNETAESGQSQIGKTGEMCIRDRFLSL